MKKKNIYIAVLFVLVISVLLVSGFKWYGKGAKDIAQGQEMLEKITDSDLTYRSEISGVEAYNYVDENISYIVDKDDGTILGYVNYEAHDEERDTSINLDENQLIEIAEQEILTLCSSFFDHDVEYTVSDAGDDGDDRNVYANQITETGRLTGNSITVRITENGTIYSIHIFNDEDASIADNEPAISEEEAIEIAYEAAQNRMDEFKDELETQANNTDTKAVTDEEIYNDQGELIQDEPATEYTSFEIYLDERDNHQVNTKLSVHDGKRVWFVEINNVENNTFDVDKDTEELTMNMILTIDANTGEVLVAGYAN